MRRIICPLLGFVLTALASCTGSPAGGLRAVGLSCEYRQDPLGINTDRPRLSWELESTGRDQRQSAYRLLVASSEELLHEDTGDLWDTGRVESQSSICIRYAGKKLRSGQKCWWKVRCWTKGSSDGENVIPDYYNPEFIELLNSEQEGSYSNPSSFEMGLLEKDDWNGTWIGAEQKISSPLLRKTFDIEKEILNV